MEQLSPEVFRQYAFFVAILAFRIMGQSLLNAGDRVFRSLEERGMIRVRFRRNHLSDGNQCWDDLDMILCFIILGLLYAFCHPATSTANFIFKSFTISRFLHCLISPVRMVRQPVKAFCWAGATVVNGYMAFKVFFYFV